MSAGFTLSYAWRALRRDGQRTLLALLCVVFGAMSLVAMELLAGMMNASINPDPRAFLNGDAEATVNWGPLTPAQLAELDRLQATGTIRSYSLLADGTARWLKPPGTGRVYLLTSPPLGVDPATFPAVGQATLREPAGLAFGAAIARPLSAVITRDLADKLHLRVGDSITLNGGPGSAPLALTIGGIAATMPAAHGDGVYYSLDTARRLAGTSVVANHVSLIWGVGGPAPARLTAAGWQVRTAADVAQNNGNTSIVFNFMLRGAGILGLFVGGIGVLNTLQVMMARRRMEIATLKTVGFRREALLALFGVETALLGLAGGVLGTAAGVAVAAALVGLLGRVGIFLITWTVDPGILAGGVLAGMITAVIFGLQTIVRASAVRPAVLLRDLPTTRGWRTLLGDAALLALLVALATILSGVILNSALQGAQVIGGALAGLVALTILFGVTLFVLLRLPLPPLPVLRLARQNLKRQSLRAVFALIALFMGVFAIGLATSAGLSALNRVHANVSTSGYNLTVYGQAADAAAISRQLAAAGVAPAHAGLRVPVAVQTAGGQPIPDLTYLDGRTPADGTWDLQVVGAPWTGAAGTALLPVALQQAPWSLHAGDALTATPAGGTPQRLRVAGFYRPLEGKGADLTPSGVVTGRDLVAALAGPDAAVIYSGQVDPARLADVTATLGAALPEAAVVSNADLNDAVQRIFTNLLSFVIAVAALALLAGAVLIANTVGLAMVERRREMGILKAVGFTGGRVLATLLLENALLGALAGTLGMIGVALALVLINRLQPAAQLTLSLPVAAVLIVVAVALALGSTVAVAWRPTHVRPLEVLRME